MADYAITQANLSFSVNAKFEVGRGKTGITRGDSVVKVSNIWQKANATAASDAADVLGYNMFGIAATDCEAAGQPLVVCLEDNALAPGFTLTLRDYVCVSNADGKWMPSEDLTSGEAIIPCMTPVSTTKAIFNPKPTGKRGG